MAARSALSATMGGMAITVGSIVIFPLSLQVDPGVVSVRLFACQQEWENTELDAKRITLRAGHLDFLALPLKIKLEPFWPVDFRLEFPVQTLSEPLLLRCSRGMLLRKESLDLLHQPLSDPEERRLLDELCYRAWFERAVGLDLAYEPRKLRSGESHLDEAAVLLERYLHVKPADQEALKSLERVRLKKELARRFHAGDWNRVRKLSEQIRIWQPDWQGPEGDDENPMESAQEALRHGWLEVAEDRLLAAVARRETAAAASLMLARLSAGWQRDLARAAHWYVNYFENAGPNGSVAYEAMEVLHQMGATGTSQRGALLAILSERLVMRPDDSELADLVFALAEAQASAGVDVTEDFSFLWACYEKAFEHQVAVDRRVERTLLARLERLHERLGNVDDWIRIRRSIADLEPGHPEFREQLARFLTSQGHFEAALSAQMALWMAEPIDLLRTETVVAAAEAAGAVELQRRASQWLALLRGETPRGAWGRFADQTPVRFLLHPELRSIAPLLLKWETGSSESARIEDVEKAVRRLFGPLSPEQWRELETLGKHIPLVPALEAGVIVRNQKEMSDMHPLRVAARLSIDRMTVARSGDFLLGMQTLALPGWQPGESLLQVQAIFDIHLRRLTLHRVREMGRFYLGRLWDNASAEWTKFPDSPIADLIEAVYLHGVPDRSTRAFFDDTRRQRKISRHDWGRIEGQVLDFLRLSTGRLREEAEI